MTRALKQLVWIAKTFRLVKAKGQRIWSFPRPGYCWCCGAWTWLTLETQAFSTGTGFLCDECADENDKEWENHHAYH